MGRIIQLTQEIISKTSAGEIVERPASVVKELIENSIDASATSVEVYVEDAGLKSIKVIDNGSGMDKEDIEKCVLPHTTSKLHEISDISSIATFGFRGEALGVIASVSILTIRSRQDTDELGYLLRVDGGVFGESGQAGCAKGTSVEVEDLFYNVPARRKFLKSDRTEFRNILDTVIRFVLSHPEVGFKFCNDGGTVFDFPPDTGVDKRLQYLFGEAFTSNLLSLENNEDHFKLSGYVAKPLVASETKTNQFVFVNKRPVNNQLISSAVRSAFGGLIEPKSHPSFILYFTLPFDLVDVNVHPRKEEVAFYDDAAVTQFIKNSVDALLKATDLTYTSGVKNTGLLAGLDGKADYYTFNVLKDSVDVWDARTVGVTTDDNKDVIQLNRLYLIASEGNNLAIYDQHAAHERILYEQFLDAFEKNQQLNTFIKLDKAVILDLSIQQVQILMDNLGSLISLGFEIEEFGQNSFKILSVPDYAKYQDINLFMKEILEDLSQNKELKSVSEKALKTIAFLACRSAVKAGDYLDQEERSALISKLAETKSNYTCPHGRPVKVEVTSSDLAKMFKRIK